MFDNKQDVVELQTPVSSDHGYDGEPDQGIQSGTAQDADDMHRLGKKQEFKRNFHAFSMLGLSSVLMGTWCVAANEFQSHRQLTQRKASGYW